MLSGKQGKLRASGGKNMATLKVFDYEIDQHGAKVVVARTPMMPGCLTDCEIDANIKLLKEDLDAVAAKMKTAVRKQRGEPLRFG
jgi:hypothetical protein